MTGRVVAMLESVVVAILVWTSSVLGQDLHHTSLSHSSTHHLLPSLSEDLILLSSHDATRYSDSSPVPTHLSLDEMSKTPYRGSQAKPTKVIDQSPSTTPVILTHYDSHQAAELDLNPTQDLQSASITHLRHIPSLSSSPDLNPITNSINHSITSQVLVLSKTDRLVTRESQVLSPSSSDYVIRSSVPPLATSQVEPSLPILDGEGKVSATPTNAVTITTTATQVPHPNSTAGDGASPMLKRSVDKESATLTQEEFNSILTRFSLDALQATQIAERLGLAGAGVAELEQELMLGGDLQGPGGPNDRPLALPLDRNIRTTPQRSLGSSITHATKRLFLGDPSLCYAGSCEFFLLCWMGGGLIDGGCGGFLFACCNRPNQRGQRGPESFRDDSVGLIPVDYGPIRNDHGCGLSTSSRLSAQRRIVGGTEAGFGSFPWQAYIRIGSSRCGGSLINQYHVVTAGHCVARARPHQIRVTLGDYVLNSDREPLGPLTFGATEIKVHPKFKFTPQADRFDVAVITLDAPVHYQPHVQPICLPEKGADWLGSYAWAAGWGALQSGSRLRPKTLQVVDVPILDSRLCEDWHRQKGINVIIYDEMMCAGYGEGGKDSCQGDSGGPLMIQDGGRWYLAGIVSAGYSCAQGKQPGIYHKVSYTSDWISWAAST
ncbi:uncharacterized protein [Procambarus clarkii]|uniref:uncharacterized protein n=1 Tax=Procambarus clarkii TaxID=6728 RepID=UPI003742B255